MRRLVWSPRAVADLAGIREYISQDSEIYAALMLSRLVAAPDRLPQFPEAGRVVPEFATPSLRELIVRPYREVVTVFHAARLTPDFA